MMTKIKNIVSAGLLCCGVAAALTACTDTWDDHYEGLGGTNGVHEGTLWQAIKTNPELSNFAKVVEACDFAKSLDGSQVFTVFAPTNDKFSDAQAQALIAEYQKQVADSVLEEDNTVLKEFIQNHVALYNHSVSSLSNDSIVLMNGKYALLTNDAIDGVRMKSKNELYGNGVLYTLEDQVDYLSNVFEYVRKDADLDSLRSFLYNSHYYYKEFMPALSVPGSIVDGKTQYLDSVFTQRNELYSYLGLINSEDSTYWMVAPTNEVWKQLVEEYEPYFNYPEGVEDRDSMVYTNTRMAIVSGTTFSRTFNPDASLNDSVLTENSIKNYTSRKAQYGMPFEYYIFRKAQEPEGYLDQNEADIINCSNGQVRKDSKWDIDKQMTFFQYRVIEAEGRNAIKELSKVKDSHGDSIATVSTTMSYVTSDNRNFYDRVWSNSFVEFKPEVATVNHSVTFYIADVLSNIGYDIYLVSAPALASDSNATSAQRIPTLIRCTLNCPGQGTVNLPVTESGKATNLTTKADSIDYLLLAEDFKFDYCTVGVEDEDLQVTLKVETRASATQYRNQTYSRTMRIDCILLVPHGSLLLPEALPADDDISVSDQGYPGVLMYPHGQSDKSKRWYMLR